MHRGKSWPAALIAGVLTWPAAAAPATAGARPELTDLGPGAVIATNGRGDALIWSGDAQKYLVLDHRHHDPVEFPFQGRIYDPVDMNERGDVVTGGHLWHDGRLTVLQDRAGTPMVGQALNDHGVVAGHRSIGDSQVEHPAILRNGVIVDFPGWQGMTAGRAVDVNNRGQVLVDLYDESDGTQRAVIWAHDRITDLGSIDGAPTHGVAINDRGTVIGYSGFMRPVRWQNGVLTGLTDGLEITSGLVYALSERGDIAGQANHSPALWRDGTVIFPAPGRAGRATAVNERGDVAGVLERIDGDWAAITNPFRWRRGDTRVYTLPGDQITWSTSVSLDIHGRVLGSTVLTDFTQHIVRWNVPAG
ncbi:hypothetical protein [Catenuloplanes indicus]|uniref:Membrane protein n=1 Tax=Catenuloplanes indicus TaxID=137267 RepID=A0AAE4AU97_9ACTN|nr:hypothetical protein [Catenuloplanes indicus]MDQ0363555.1 putative membrane protein [Catenuloplanes indicus]